ncbi:EmrB/QacA subfamily drug resistance transporter [Saccharothrix ecbatanensis]|uniref:EmrB/QacA subfamily drug resistance transporter n=1 Tax=Saccharothrix ecbatanensis TaxID=1105145 RepID=A0A7W9HIZ6_9PSEU|nr:MFS transporter [Saccharothrix ecbatanensis]MBB5803085.1 EmrB/QacA subfamily drug resistance transporter [Saccharothrix ecbatanensis]
MTTPPTLPKFRQQLILAVLMVCSLLIWLDNTVLSTALETLADPVRGLGADPGELQWATGSYTLAFATLMFTAGALGDRFGHRTVFSSGLAIFAGASLWAAYANDAGQLIAARAAMGVGSALITPAMLAILMWTFTGPARAAAIGIFSTSAGVGMAIGPVLAGFLLDHFWWGSVFLINVPVAALALIGLALLVPNFRSPTLRPLDPAGMLLSIGGLVALAYGLIRAGQVTAWSRADVWAPIVVGLVLLAGFVLVELRVKAPSFDPRLLAQRTFGGGNVALGLLLFAVAAITFYNAFYLQGALGFSPMKAGLATIPTALGALVGAPLATRLVRRLSLRPVAVPALTVAALTMGGYGFLGLQTPLVWIEILLLVQGLSIGMVIGPVTAALIGDLPLDRAGAGSAITNTVRQTGSVVGIAVGGSILSIVYRRAIEPSLEGVPGPVRDQARISAEQARHVATATNRPTLAQAADDAFIHAMHVGAGWIAVITLLGAAVLLVALPGAGKRRSPIPGPGADHEEARGSEAMTAAQASRT